MITLTALTSLGTTTRRKTPSVLMGVAALASLGAAPLFAQTPAAPPPSPSSPSPSSPVPPAADSKAPVKVSVAARISTLGLGLEASALVTPNIAVRVGYNGYTYGHSASYQGVDYDGKLKLSSVPLLADLYPSQHSGFHVTAGLLFNSNTLTAHGRPSVNGGTQTFTLNNNTYNVSDVGSLDGRVTFSKISPYLGIGFGKPSGGGSMLQLLFDLGVVFQGKPNLSLTRNGGTTDPALASVIDADLSAQRDKTRSDLNNFQFYPVISFGLAYHF